MSEGKAEIRTEGARKEEKNWSHHFFDNDKKKQNVQQHNRQERACHVKKRSFEQIHHFLQKNSCEGFPFGIYR